MRESRKRLVYEVRRRLRRGESKRAISRALHIDRKTVRSIIEEIERRREQGDDALERAVAPRAPRPSKLDPFIDDISKWMMRYPDIRATRLHEELRELGFDGGYTIVREYLGKVRPKAKKKPRTPVRTAPGQQGQFDWSDYWLKDGTPVYAFSCVLKFSRYLYLHFCPDRRQPTIFRQLRRAFEHHGGIAEEYVTDSMPGIVDRWELEEPVLNLRAVDFAGFYDFAYHIAPRGDGAYKGGVERSFRHTNTSLFNARDFYTLEELNDKTAWWLEHRVNCRPHGTLKRRPVDMLQEELEHLRALPPHPFDDRELRHRLVDDFCYVHFDGNRYLAPSAHVGRWVYVRADEQNVQIHDSMANKLAEHRRAPRSANRFVPEPPMARKGRRSITQLMRRFEELGPSALAFATSLRQVKRYAGVELARVLELQRTWSTEDLLAAIAHAHRYGAHDAAAVERVLRATAQPRSFEDHLAERTRRQVKQSMARTPVRQRGLDEYRRLLGGSVTTSGDAPKEGDDAPTQQAAPRPTPEQDP